MRADHPSMSSEISSSDTTLLPYCECMIYNGFTGDKSVPSTRFRAFTANQHQVAAGLCRRLSPTALIGAVPSATAPATARHASGMENESKNPSAPPPAVGLILLGTWSTLSRTSPVHPKHREEAHRSIDLNSSARSGHRLSAAGATFATHPIPVSRPVAFLSASTVVRCRALPRPAAPASGPPRRAIAWAGALVYNRPHCCRFFCCREGDLRCVSC